MSSNNNKDLLNPGSIPDGETPATLRRQLARGRDVQPSELNLDSDPETGAVDADLTPDAMRQRVAAQSDALDTDDVRVDGDSVTVRDDVGQGRDADTEPSVVETGDTNIAIEPRGTATFPDTGPNAGDDVLVRTLLDRDTITIRNSEGDVVASGRNAEDATDSTASARFQPAEGGEFSVFSGEQRVGSIRVDERGGETTVVGRERAKKDRTAASAAPDIVAGAGADEALQAGVKPEVLSQVNPISESEGQRIADAVEQAEAQQQQQQQKPDRIGEGMSDTALAQRGSEANRRLRERIASDREGLDASQVDVVATDDGLAYRTDADTIGESELDFGTTEAQSPGPTAPSPDEAFDDAFRGETQDTGRTAGDVRAAVTRFGQRQLDQQAIGRANGPDGTTPGLVDRVLNADADPEIARDLTDSGGLFAEDGDSGAIVTDLTGVSEADLRDPSDNVLPGVLPTRQQVRRGGADDALAIPADPEQRGSTAGEGVPERAIEGAATAGLSILNIRQRAADAEQIIEGLQALPSETRQEGAGDVGETIVALGRREGVEAARRAESEPVRFGSGLALDVAGGAVATGRVPDARDVRAEIDPRIGLFGETIESRALGLRSDESASGSDVDVDRSQTRGDQVSRLPGERPTGLTAEAVDDARGVSDPSRTSRIRGELERRIQRARDRLQTERERISVETRLGAGLGSLEVRRDTDTTPDAPGEFDPSRSEILAGSPRDRISDEVADRQRQAVQRFDGDTGGPAPFGDDGAVFDPTADAETLRREAERRFIERDDGGLDTGTPLRQQFRPDASGAIGGAILGGALARDEQVTQTGVDQDLTDFAGSDAVTDLFGGSDTGSDVDTRPDTDVFGRVDIDQDTRTRLDTDPDTDTRTRQDSDTRDPSQRDPNVRDPDDPNDPMDPRTPRDPDTPSPPLEPDDEDEERGGVFSLFAAERDFDSGIAGASEAFDAILGGGNDADATRMRDLRADRTEEFEFRY